MIENNLPSFFSSLRLFSFRCFMQHVIIINLIMTKRMEPRTMATIITRGTASLSWAVFSEAKNKTNIVTVYLWRHPFYLILGREKSKHLAKVLVSASFIIRVGITVSVVLPLSSLIFSEEKSELPWTLTDLTENAYLMSGSMIMSW